MEGSSLAAILAVLTTAIVFATAASASAATFGVNSQNDANDGTCDGSHCSLREAILAANATAGADQILFALFADGAPISPTSQLPAITDTVRITARPNGRCFTDSTPLHLKGTGADFTGLVFAPGSDGSHICMVTVGGFKHGIELQSDQNKLQLSQIGTDGNAADPNSEDGIVVTGDDNLIGGTGPLDGNVISGNAITGIFVAGAAGTRIEGNRIGTDSSGSTAIPNSIGVQVEQEASDTTVGGAAAGAGNVISGNELFGVSSDDGRVVGNLIGLDADGTMAIPNGIPGFTGGVLANGPIQIGGPTEAERNVISGQEVADVVLRAPATVQGNWIGLNADGTALPGDAEPTNGIRLLAGADGARIGGAADGEGNVIAGQLVSVESVDSSSGFSVQGNLIGLAADGTTAVATGTGIKIGAGTTGALVGGVEDGAGNTVTALEAGIAVAGEGTRIEHNTVGLNEDGDPVFPQDSGIAVEGTAERTAIGGDRPGAGNTISGNFMGVELRDGSAGTVVEGNFIGTDQDGMDARPNDVGILIGDEEELGGERVEARIGGTRSAQRNVISGNFDVGVDAHCTKADVVIEGNYIGVGENGSTELGNGVGLNLGCDSFIVPAPAADDGFVVGGTAPGAGNRIAHNDGDDFDFGEGVRVGHTSGGVMILGNEIFDNDSGVNNAPGIDLFDEGVSANGSQGPDVLPPFPVLTNVDAVAAGTLVQGTIDYPAGRDVRIEFFSNPGCDASGHGEGQTPLGALTITGSGAPAAFGARLAAAPAGLAITATATDLDRHRTSEFSRCALSTGPPPADPPPGDPPPGPGPGDPPAPGPVGNRPGPQLGIPVIDVPPRPRCKVPNVVGLTPAKAKRRLRLAGCGIGKVTKPNRRPGKRFRLVVKRTSLRRGATRPPGAAIGLTLKWKRIETRRR